MYRAFGERLTGETVSETLGAPTISGPGALTMHRIQASLAPLESCLKGLSNGAKLVKNGYFARNLWGNEVGE